MGIIKSGETGGYMGDGNGDNNKNELSGKTIRPWIQCGIKHVQTRTYLDVFHQFLRAVLTVQHSQVREDARVSIVQTETLSGVSVWE